MNKDKIIHPTVKVSDTDDFKYDTHGRVSSFRDKNGIWQIKNHKDLKKATPDNAWKKGDVVKLDSITSTVNKSVLTGDYIFDSYDVWDNTCYVSKDKFGAMTWNILLSDLPT